MMRDSCCACEEERAGVVRALTCARTATAPRALLKPHAPLSSTAMPVAALRGAKPRHMPSPFYTHAIQKRT